MQNPKIRVAATCGPVCRQGFCLVDCLSTEGIELTGFGKAQEHGHKMRYWHMPKQPNGLPLKWHFSSLGAGWLPTGLPADYVICEPSDKEILWVSENDPTQEYRMIRPTEFFR